MSKASTGHRTAVSRWQKAAILAPVVVLVAAWSANLGSADEKRDPQSSDLGLPDVPANSVDDPANYTQPPSLDPETFVTDPNHDSTDPDTTAAQASEESANGIPAAALAAYRRTEVVLAQADPACHLPWELVAAIGRVESDHGRHGGSVLGDDGKSRPGIYGIALNGAAGTALVHDSDRGSLDHDRLYDRAVGPMQFIPTTWEIVGVDADGDDVRDPQDIDDAALAAGVYLCAGDNDLATDAGRRAAVYSYNHSEEYVTLVLAIMRAYMAGNYDAVANGLPSNDDVTVEETDQEQDRPKPGQHKPGTHHNGGSTSGNTSGGNNGNGGGSPTPGGGSGGGGGNGGGNGGNGGGSNDDGPLKPVEDTVTTAVDPVGVATRKCTDALAAADIPQTPVRLQQCVDAYLDGGMAAVNNLVSGLLDTLGLDELLGGGSGGSGSGGGGLLGGALGGGRTGR